MSSDRFVYLLTKQLSASLSTAEETELSQLLLEPENEQSQLLLKKYWQTRFEDASPDVEKALLAVMQKIGDDNAQPVPLPSIPTHAIPKRVFSFYRVAAAAVLVAAMAMSAYFILQKQSANNTRSALSNASVVEKQNAKGTRSIITLADGSKVWLNADSKLEYPAMFEGGTREVSLSGEAFFDVSKNKQKPFIIHLKAGTVRVLGTSFNIKAYDNSPSVETSVASGRVAFIPKASGSKKVDTVFLTPDLKAVYLVESGNVKTLSTSSAVDKAWTEGKLLFSGAGMDEIATTLERNFGKQVIINDDELRSYRFSGSFENDRLEEILYYLSKSKPFTFRITETQVILSAVR